MDSLSFEVTTSTDRVTCSMQVLMTFAEDAEDAAGRLIWDGLLRLLVSTLPGVTQSVDQIFFHSWTAARPGEGTLGATTWMPPGPVQPKPRAM